jgi:DNA repair photolyase
MIISASRRSDIPAFYGEWFMNRVKTGYFLRVNPINKKQQKIISLLLEDVDCFVFWSKYPAPFLKNLAALNEWGYKYYFHYTINDYPLIFEPRLPGLEIRTDTFKRLSETIGPAKIVWRYDPIIISNQTSVDYHIRRFAKLAFILGNYTHRVIISFLDLYGKVNAKLNKFKELNQLAGEDITKPENKEQLHVLMRSISAIARAAGLEMQTCAERVDLSKYGVSHAKCLDTELIHKVFGLSLDIKKDPAQRPECLCASAVDMGFYDTCKFNCSYCYATLSEKAVQNNLQKYNPKSPAMLNAYAVKTLGRQQIPF